MEITAAVLTAPKEAFDVRKVDLDTAIRPDEILVKVVATGLCHTDLTMRAGNLPIAMPVILGHEGAGIVEQIGSAVTKVKLGDHVILAPASCGKCSYCESGHPSYCEKFYPLNFGGHRLDGSCPHHDHSGEAISGMFFGQSSFANYALTYENNVVKVQDDVPLELLGPLGCGIQTGAGAVLNVLKPSAGQSIVISGVGPVGTAAIMAAKVAGLTTIIAVDVHENRLELARELGATHTINSKDAIISEEVNRIIPGGTHYAVDTTARNEVINQMVGSMRYLGRCVTLGIGPSPKMEIDNLNLMFGRSVQNVLEGDSVPDIFIPQLISLYKQGLFPFDKLIKFYDLQDINQAVEDSEKGVTLKAVLRMPN